MDEANSPKEQVALRLPDDWRRALKIAAAMNGRSMNAEIVHRLRPTLEATDAQRPQS